MNRTQKTFAIVAPLAFLAAFFAAMWVLYLLYEAPARRAAELQAEIRNEYLKEQLNTGENHGMQHTIDGKTLQGN